MKGAVTPLHRKALLNALKTAAVLDPERLDELLDATSLTFVALGWDAGEDLWTLGPLLETAGRMARHEDQVQEKLPRLARALAQRQVVSPDRYGLDIEREESLTLSLLSITARVDRLTERETFGMSAEEAHAWILDVVLQAAAHVYGELEKQDAAASNRPDMGVDGKQMILQSALRETLNLLEPAWLREARGLETARNLGDLGDLRAWIETHPEDLALSRIVESLGEGVDTLIQNLSVVRSRVSALRDRLSKGWNPAIEETVAGGKAPEPDEKISATPAPSPEESPLTTTPLSGGLGGRRVFGRRR